ncbi:MAG: Protein YchQ [Candidatus Celerinatantimonas neptuna]|nr:MAG: Protein YchQ [Candidatus Celerinatantimonas neptuna]
MSYFSALIYVHIISAILSVCGFIFRWQYLLKNTRLPGSKLFKIAPHVIDTVLLASGIWMCISIDEYPFTKLWLTAKLLLLIVYIGLGTMALKCARDRHQRLVYGVLR